MNSVDNVQSITGILSFVGPTAAFSLVLTYLWMRQTNKDRELEREQRVIVERMRTGQIDKITEAWNDTTGSLLKSHEDTRQHLEQVNLSVKEVASAIAHQAQSNRHNHQLMYNALRDLTVARVNQQTPTRAFPREDSVIPNGQ